VDLAKNNMATTEQINSLAEMFKQLGDPTRMKILYALLQTELCVCDISALLGMTSSAISHQLKQLRDTRVVKTRREGKVIFYSLDDDHIRAIIKLSYEHICNKC
jgi:ArsR family transcriptional regulator